MKLDHFAFIRAARAGGELKKQVSITRREHGRSELIMLLGEPGTGKRTLIEQFGNSNEDYRIVEVPADPTAQSFENAFYKGVHRSESAYYTRADCRWQTIKTLKMDGAPPVAVLPGDRLTEKLVDITIDILDRSGSSGIICGGGGLRKLLLAPKTALLARAADRIAATIELPRPSLGDARLPARELMDLVKLEDDLIKAVYDEKGKSLRSLLRTYLEVEIEATARGLNAMDLRTWRALNGDGERQQIITDESAKTKTLKIAHQRAEVA